jgi:hypothetical protein
MKKFIPIPGIRYKSIDEIDYYVEQLKKELGEDFDERMRSEFVAEAKIQQKRL